MDKGEIENIESWEEDGDVIIVINYEDGGYDEMRVYAEEVGSVFSYVSEGC